MLESCFPSIILNFVFYWYICHFPSSAMSVCPRWQKGLTVVQNERKRRENGPYRPTFVYAKPIFTSFLQLPKAWKSNKWIGILGIMLVLKNNANHRHFKQRTQWANMPCSHKQQAEGGWGEQGHVQDTPGAALSAQRAAAWQSVSTAWRLPHHPHQTPRTGPTRATSG